MPIRHPLVGIVTRFAAVALAVFPFAASHADAPRDGALSPSQPGAASFGGTPGTFHFSLRPHVVFSHNARFPVDLVIEDYTHREVKRESIGGPASGFFSCDLPPGSYRIVCRPVGKGRDEYWGSDRNGGSADHAFFIAPDGVVTSARPIGEDFILKRKIVLLRPGPQEVFLGNTASFRWKPLPGVRRYTVIIAPLDHPDHPKSFYIADQMRLETARPAMTRHIGLKDAELDLHPKAAYAWTVLDGWEEPDSYPGHLGLGEGVFLTAGAPEFFRNLPAASYGRDEGIEPRLGLGLQQVFPSGDSPQVDHLLIESVGTGTPALAAGLRPGDEMRSIDGRETASLLAFHRYLEGLPVGKTVMIEVRRRGERPAGASDDVRRTFHLTLN